MVALRIEPADDTPLVILDKANQKFEISGKSLPEDVIEFYRTVLDWMNEYVREPLEKTVFEFKMIYFNTASSKLILDILMILEEIQEKGKAVLVQWKSLESDEDMKEAGEEYAEMVDIPFQYDTFSL